ncbi:serine/threonine-protein kinase/endoribonuclease IRE1-like isoform X1 [Penaeus japonicus]|uniref:serine/threonine-protein kinase/endoribonuclease IRE1-like isoform X1 n=1 Tax=Penaeus japonicus TaxID=27405 RepID=UPI001C70DC6A|nr:serine/threonine-protein kinase/endoribonuclease IRE1-like isoform X1 [Penaeus japonicus]
MAFSKNKILWMSIFWTYVLLSAVYFPSVVSANKKSSHMKERISNTELLSETDDETLLISTLDGALHAITKSSGAHKWTLKDDPVIINPTDSSQPPIPQFFPNPQDGSLYRYTLGRGRDPLKKLPFTIPQLVANSPCRSSDGIFYLGKKTDSWVGVDSITGEKQLVLGMDIVDRKCPKPSRNTVYFGRTLYNIILYEASTGNKWNISFSEYATSGSSSTVQDYELVHYTSTGEGSILTVDQMTGSLLWTLDLESPLVAMYQLGPDGGLQAVPTTTVAPQTLNHFTKEFMHLTHQAHDGSDALLIKKLSPTIYIGECSSGVYAVPALVDTNTVTISRKESQLLLEGPPGFRGTLGSRPSQTASDAEDDKKPDVLLLGYYEVPDKVKSDLAKATPEELADFNNHILPLGITHEKNESDAAEKTTYHSKKSKEERDSLILDGMEQIKKMNFSFIASGRMLRWWGAIFQVGYGWLFADPLNLLVVILILGLGGIGILLYKQAKDYARLSQEMSSRRLWSQGSNNSTSGSTTNVTAQVEELENGSVRVGKIEFDPLQLLGKGCDGTFVFQGSFDGRSVAVKRVLPRCFSIADREVDLLRESDQHPNVIRYFCTEQCRQFRYIALELCSATLEDFVQGRFKADISDHTILHQATSGLQHLHNLDIVHRDIKPHNVLLSIPNNRGDVRAMISDFGLCKRLETGRMSFSRRSGITGTEGWIAPEMMLNTSRPTCKVDIFSLGCVYYYLLTKGRHPFGSVLDRQSNIISGKYLLDDLGEEKDVCCRILIEKMISSKASERPPISAIQKHPFYWNKEKVLGFFQDVSDRVEKEGGDSLVVMNLERGNLDVVRGDWRQHMHAVIAEDLRRFRDYKGWSVRDLLRALRNKRNHYRELKEEARQVFGRIPDQFISYWTDRFPKLLIHTWLAMHCVKTEPIFTKYYDSFYNFCQAEDSDSEVEEAIQDEFLHENHSFAPNNPHWTGTPRMWAGSSMQEQQNPSYSLLDAFIRRSPGKGTNNKDKKEDKPPVWVIRKPQNTFEPRYKASELRSPGNIDGPWRRLPEEMGEKEKQQKVRIESTVLSGPGDVESIEAVNPNMQEEESQGCDDKLDDQPCTDVVNPQFEGSKIEEVPQTEKEGAPENNVQASLPEKRRDASQLRFRPVRTSPEKQPPEPDKQIKIVTGTGKKKKTKNIVLGGNE